MLKRIPILALAALLFPSIVLAQGALPPSPGSTDDPMVIISQNISGTDVNTIVIKSVIPSNVAKTVQGSQSAQPAAQSSPLFPSAPNASAVVIGNQNVVGSQVVNKSDTTINAASMTKIGVVKYDVSSQLAAGADANELIANAPAMDALLNQGAKTFLPSNINVADNKIVTTQKVGEMTFNAYQTSDGKTVMIPDAYTAQLIQQTGINPMNAKADYTFLNGSASKAANSGALKDYGFTTDQVQKASGGDPNANLDYLALTYTNANADAVKAKAQVEAEHQWQALAQGKGPLAEFAKVYKETFDYEMAHADPNFNYAQNLLYATQAAAQSAIAARNEYVENQYLKARADLSIGKNYAAINTLTGIGANGDYLTTDVDPTFWADLYLQMQEGALAQGNDVKQVSMVFVYSTCPPGVPCKLPVPAKPGTDPFAPTVNGGGGNDIEGRLKAAGYNVDDLGDMCSVRDWSIDQDNPSLPPNMNSGKTGPNNPVVINQDPTKRGVDISLNVTVPPVFVSYNATHTERINERPDPKDPTKTIWDKEIKECRRQTITLIDRVANMNATLDLSATSIQWITTDLALRYPGLRVYQAHWDVFPGLCAGGTLNDFREFGCFAKSIPLKDPGYYVLLINGLTTGTVVTAPRPIFYTERMGVSALMVALIK